MSALPAVVKSTSDKRRGVKDGKMFNKLFVYIDSHNSEAQKIEMTVPIITKMSHLCFYIPKEFQENPPTPKNPEVFTYRSMRRCSS